MAKMYSLDISTKDNAWMPNIVGFQDAEVRDGFLRILFSDGSIQAFNTDTIKSYILSEVDDGLDSRKENLSDAQSDVAFD
jgi:hypothetical protein